MFSNSRCLDDAFFDVFRTLAGLGLDFIFRTTAEPSPGVLRQVFRDFVEIGHGVDAKDELHSLRVPAIQMLRLREVRVAAQT